MTAHVAKAIYPAEPWTVTEDRFDFETNQRDETIFALGNGFIGMRGNFEEGHAGAPNTSLNGTYLNGFYDSAPIIYPEVAYGFARNHQTMLNVTDSKIVTVQVDGESVSMIPDRLISFRRVLDMRAGTLTRDVVWQSTTGKQLRIKITRLVSLPRKNLAAISYEIEPLNFDGELLVTSSLNAEVHNQIMGDDPRVGSSLVGQVLSLEEKYQEGTFAAVRQRTSTTRFGLVCAMDHAFESDSPNTFTVLAPAQMVQVAYAVAGERGKKITLEKFISYFTSQDFLDEQLYSLASQEVVQAKALGFEQIKAEQRSYLDDFWRHSDIEIDGDDALQQGLRFNMFHLLQSVGKDGRTNIAAKGVTGEGYEGHYFWDTETYILPAFLYTKPEISKKLLEHRCSLLPKARERASEMSNRGALYAWRTINGEEASAYFPAGTAQYHINADIAHALKRYVNASGDMAFLYDMGAEMLFETSRLWADVGDYIPGKGYCINMVTGPDEYTACVNNNAYTNLMAKDHLEYAVYVAELMRENNREAFARLSEKIGLSDGEVEGWKKAAQEMFIAYDEARGIIAQDDCFLEKAVWDFENTPAENYPLLLHYHPLVIYRYQVLKQADLVLALFLQGQRFSQAEKKRNFDYYERITTHDSSLSTSIHSIVACELGYREKAYNYFMQTARMDLDDYHDNVKDGIHCAAMAGSRLGVIHGFAGMREIDGNLHFKPILPGQWQSYTFRVNFRGRSIEIAVSKEAVSYQLLDGPPLSIVHQRSTIELQKGSRTKIRQARELEAVIFDLDGVITDTAEFHFQAWKAIADEIGTKFDRVFNERLKGVSRMQSLELILAGAGRKFSDGEKAEMAHRKNELYKEYVQTIKPDQLLPGVLDLLKELKAKGIKIGLASASKNAGAVIDLLKVGSYFDCIVDGHQVKKSKPDPEVFMLAADLLKVPYENCLGVEDAEAGVEAIKAAQMFAVGVGDDRVLKTADWVAGDTSELTLQKLREKMLGGAAAGK